MPGIGDAHNLRRVSEPSAHRIRTGTFACDDDRLNRVADAVAVPRPLTDEPLLAIGVALRDDLLYTGDRATAAEQLSAAREYVLTQFAVDARSLVVPAVGAQSRGDTGGERDRPLLDNVLYFLALDAVGWVASELGDTTDLHAIEDRLAVVRSGFLDVFWRGDELRSPGYVGEADEGGHAVATLANLLPATHLPAVRDVLARKHHTSPPVDSLVVQALFAMGEPAAAIDRLLSGGADARAVLIRHAAGIAPTAPGYATYRVRPQLGPLRRVNAEAPTPAGPVHVSIERVGSIGATLALDLPAGVDGQLELPASWFGADVPADVRVDGRRPFALWIEEPTIGRVLAVEVPPGRHEVTVAGAQA